MRLCNPLESANILNKTISQYLDSVHVFVKTAILLSYKYLSASSHAV